MLSIAFIPTKIVYEAPPNIAPEAQNQPITNEIALDKEIYALARKYQIDAKLASKIISCESSNFAYATGTRAVIGKDIGYWQFNTHFWEEKLKALGFDIYDPRENLEAGFYVLSKYGIEHWNASKYCWNL